MLDRRLLLLAGGACVFASSAFAAGLSKKLDPDSDGTMDADEAKTAAGAAFDKMDKDREGTLDVKELHGRVSKSELMHGDPDKDKTLTKDEYQSMVDSKFKAADSDQDGTLTAKELKSPKGKALMRLLK